MLTYGDVSLVLKLLVSLLQRLPIPLSSRPVVELADELVNEIEVLRSVIVEEELNYGS